MQKLILFFSIFFISILVLSQNIPYPVVPDWESTPNGHVATGLGLADINGDGWKDIIVANGNDINRQHLVVYYNQGDGSFGSIPDWQSQDIDYHGHLAVGDLNADGWIDVAVSVYIGPAGFSSPGKLKIYYNNQGILEDEPSFESYEFYTFSCAMGDADGDGDLDIATTGGEPYNNILDNGKIFYNSEGNFSSLPEWTSSFTYGSMDVDFGDVDKNGKLDLAFGTESSPNYLFIADDNGFISNVPSWQSTGSNNYMNSLDIGKIGENEIMGLVLTGNDQLGGDGKVKLYTFEEGIPPESEAVWSSTVSGYWSGILLHDVDLDGTNDLIYGGWWLPMKIHLGDPDNFDISPTYTSLTSSVVEAIQIADLNKDGMLEKFEMFEIADNQNISVFYTEHPIEFIQTILVEDVGVGPEDYCYIPGKNWVSINNELLSGDVIVGILYEYSNKGDIVITNWDGGKGNYIFYNDTIITSISHNSEYEFKFQIHPNPANDHVTIGLKNDLENEVTISISDISGRLVKRIDNQTIPEGKNSFIIYVNDLPKGLYILNLETGHFTKSKKLIIQ